MIHLQEFKVMIRGQYVTRNKGGKKQTMEDEDRIVIDLQASAKSSEIRYS